MYTNISDAIFRELDSLEDKYSNGGMQMTEIDLTMIDRMFHALKCLATYEAMEDNGNYQRGRGRDRYSYGRRY